jgi:hypothetical protein
VEIEENRIRTQLAGGIQTSGTVAGEHRLVTGAS